MLKMCLHYGCKRLALGTSSYCGEHVAEGVEARSRKDDERQRFESGRRWRAIRKAFIMRNPLCHDCERQGITKLAEEIHHIDDDHTNNLDSNLMALCKMHHSRRTNEQMKAKATV